jgi:Raf kinase inhibitor-like YbhB/YbcL family protein
MTPDGETRGEPAPHRSAHRVRRQHAHPQLCPSPSCNTEARHSGSVGRDSSHRTDIKSAPAIANAVAPDPKAPKMVWVHWVLYNIPPDTKSLPENAGTAGLPQGASLGLNDFKKTGYGGPCTPIGRHRYFHKLYALDITLDLRGATKAQIERAMQGHVLANAELVGTYQKGDR